MINRFASNTDPETMPRTTGGIELQKETNSLPSTHPAFQPNPILAPIDFSDLSKSVIEYAAGIASKGARIVLLHVLESRAHHYLQHRPEPGEFRRLDEAERKLLEVGQREAGSSVTYGALVQLGTPHREVVNSAKALSAGLIVMGAGGWNGSKPAHHGNTARYVLRHASCPVLLIMGAQNVAARPFSMKHILVPIDFSANSPRVLHYAVSLAEQFRSRLHLLHATHGYYPMPGFGPAEVISSSARTRSDAAGQLAGLATREVPNDIPADITVREGDPAGEIVGAAEDFEADLIVLSTHGYTGLRHVWFGSVAESVVRHARCPLFIIREHNHLSSS